MKNTFTGLLSAQTRHRTAAIPGTVSSVPNYPKKLKIYLNNASPYWQAMFFDRGTTYRHSCKTSNKSEAYERAKAFYEMLILRKYQHQAHLNKHERHIQQAKPEATISDYSFHHVANEWLSRKAMRWTPRHQVEVHRRLSNNLFPYIANKNIQRIQASEVLSLLQKIEERGAYDLARRVLNDCKQIWKFSMACGICKRDITEGLSIVLHPHTVNHQNAVSPEELPALMHAIDQYDKPADEIAKLGMQLLAMTFVRKSELLYAKWNEFDLDKATWKIPAERMKMRVEHFVPLSTQAIAKLKEIKQKFPSHHCVFNNGNPMETVRDNALIEAIYWMGYKGKMSVHGFRAVASTILNEHNFRPDVIEKQLAHNEQNQVRRAYNRAQYVEERREMMQWWSDYLEKISG
jgi:integrase